MKGNGAGFVVLLVATTRFEFPALLARMLHDAGLQVSAACCHNSLLTSTQAVSRRHLIDHQPQQAIAAAIASEQPALLLPCDDRATALLYALHRNDPDAAPLIERSLGAPRGYATARSKSEVMRLAARLGVATPATLEVASLAAFEQALSRRSLPQVLKSDGSWGGNGVAVIRQAGHARAAWRCLAAPPTAAAIVTAMLRQLSIAPLRDAFAFVPPRLTLQQFVAGRAANLAAFCWQGEIIAAAGVEVLATRSPEGPATLVRTSDHSEMIASARPLAAELGLSGIHGFDFLVDDSTGRAQLIELNPRATPTALIPLASGDVIAAVARHLGVDHVRSPLPNGATVAFFPGELLRPGGRPDLADLHLVPWDEPQLIRDTIAAVTERSWLRRLADGVCAVAGRGATAAFTRRHLLERLGARPHQMHARAQSARSR